jgi:hypothetical protein
VAVLLESIYERDPDVIAREIAGERILVPVRKQATDMAAIYVLNETGARVWGLLDGMRSLADVETAMSNDYDAPEETIRADLIDLVGQLQMLGMLRLVKHVV